MAPSAQMERGWPLLAAWAITHRSGMDTVQQMGCWKRKFSSDCSSSLAEVGS